jgi:TFIIF-interacting CTD phosphatase-like protein
VSADEAARIATDGVNRLLASRRLVLVLDLDHTLLNTVRDCDLVGEERQRAMQQLQKQNTVLHRQHYQQDPAAAEHRPLLAYSAAAAAEEPAEAADAEAAATDAAPTAAAAAGSSPNISSSTGTSYSGNPWEPEPKQQEQQQALRPRLFHLADKGLWTKLRPGVESFLSRVSQLYELHIYTMGDKGYAGLMADLLDPEHKLFVGRVISAVSVPVSLHAHVLLAIL